MRNLIQTGLVLLACLGAMPALADEAAPGEGCYGYLTELVRSSDFPFRDFTTPDRLKLLIDQDAGDVLTLQLFYETTGTGIIGFAEYHVADRTLWNISIDPEEPQALKFDRTFAQGYAACVEKKSDR